MEETTEPTLTLKGKTRDKTNYGIIILWIVFVAFLILATIVIVIIYYKTTKIQTIAGGGTSCDPSFADLPNLDGELCCIQNGEGTNFIYSQDFGLVLQPTPTDYQTACNVVSSNAELYQKCLNATKPPSNCPGNLASPVGYSGTNFYYVSTQSCINCETSAPCGSNSPISATSGCAS